MQYQFAERQEFIKTVEFHNSDPLLNVTRITYFKEEGISGIFEKKEYRYSFDNTIWTNWNTLTQSNLAGIQFQDRPNFWLQLKYTRTSVISGNILRWYLFYDGSTSTPPVPPLTLIDADTLQGEDGAYYLNRANHIGAYTDINMENVSGDASTVGVYHGRLDTSIGSTFFFKRLEGKSGINITESSLGMIYIDGSAAASQVIYENPDPVNQTIGGISSGESFFSVPKTFGETMKALFYPVLYPTLTAPSNTFAHNVAYLQTIGASVNINFTSTFNRGSISPAYGTSGLRSGAGSIAHFTGDGLPASVSGYPTSPLIESLTGYTVISGVKTWSGAWSYDIGEQPLDSEGNSYSSPLPAGATGYQTASIEGVYPLFGTTSSISNPNTQQTLVSMITGDDIEFDLVPESGGYRQSFDISNAWLGARPLIGVETLNTVSDLWEYEGGTAPLSLNRWTTSSVTHIIAGNLINYTRYTYNGTERSSITIRLKF